MTIDGHSTAYLFRGGSVYHFDPLPASLSTYTLETGPVREYCGLLMTKHSAP